MSFVSKASVLECLDGHWFSWRLETVLEWMLSLDKRLSGFLRSTVSLAPGIASLASPHWLRTPVFKGQQMRSERFWFRGCRNNTETDLCKLRAGVPVRDPTGNLMKAKRMHTGTSLGSVLEVSETPRSPSLDARWKDPYFRGSAREPTSGAAERKMTGSSSQKRNTNSASRTQSLVGGKGIAALFVAESQVTPRCPCFLYKALERSCWAYLAGGCRGELEESRPWRRPHPAVTADTALGP